MKKIGGVFPYVDLMEKPNEYLSGLTPEDGELKFFMSGRCGIYYALLDHKQTTDNLTAYVPIYTCETVLAPFKKAGYELLFYDFDRDMKPKFDPSVLDKISIISICGYFGFSTYDREFVAECKRRGIAVIEDTTHSIFSTDGVDPHCDYIAGSFRKWLGVPCGGFAIKTNGKFTVPTLPPNEEHINWRNELYTLRTNNPSPATPEEAAALQSQSDELFWKSEMKLRKIFDCFESDEHSAHIMKHFPVSELQEQRRKNYQYILEHLKPSSAWKLVFPVLPEGTVPCHITLYAENREEFRSKLVSQGIHCTSFWPISEFVNLEGHPDAQYIYDHVCSIPCDQRYGDAEMERICNVLNSIQ